MVTCSYGPAKSETTVVLMGDSHAMVLTDPIRRVAASDRFRLVTYLKGGCIPVLGTMNIGQVRRDGGRSCRTWRLNAIKSINANPPDLLIINRCSFVNNAAYRADEGSALGGAVRTGMIPILNSMMVVGIVSLPGMMTGQILSGVDPLVAVRYQIMVMCMVFGASGIATAYFLVLVKPTFEELVARVADKAGSGD